MSLDLKQKDVLFHLWYNSSDIDVLLPCLLPFQRLKCLVLLVFGETRWQNGSMTLSLRCLVFVDRVFVDLVFVDLVFVDFFVDPVFVVDVDVILLLLLLCLSTILLLPPRFAVMVRF